MGGSGKSYFCEQRQAAGAVVFSDFTNIDMESHSQRAGHKKLPELVATLMNGRDVVADEAHLTDPDFRREFERFVSNNLEQSVEIEWVYFEKDVQSCAANVVKAWRQGTRRDPARVKSLLDQIGSYTPPQGFPLQRCFRPGEPTFTSDPEAVAALRELLR